MVGSKLWVGVKEANQVFRSDFCKTLHQSWINLIGVGNFTFGCVLVLVALGHQLCFMLYDLIVALRCPHLHMISLNYQNDHLLLY